MINTIPLRSIRTGSLHFQAKLFKLQLRSKDYKSNLNFSRPRQKRCKCDAVPSCKEWTLACQKRKFVMTTAIEQ